MAEKVGLVLTGGGARAAYQAGVLLGISEFVDKRCFPFPIISGISAGSINAAFLACSTGSFQDSAKRLSDIWLSLESENVFQQAHIGIASFALRALANVVSKGIVKIRWPDSLLDNGPLQKLLDDTIDANAIDKRIKSGHLEGVSFTATDFSSGTTTCFFEAHPKIEPWAGKERIGVNTRLSTKHVMASSAIPGIFKLVKIGGSYFGDGSTRVAFPTYPAIRLGASRILAIDMRFSQSVSEKKARRDLHYPQLGEIFAKLLDSIFSDSLDRDLERLEIINKLVKKNGNESSKWRFIPFMLIRPSKNLASLAEDIYGSLSLSLKRLLRALGIKPGTNTRLISHLAFERVYTERLLHLGRFDALDQREKIAKFINGDIK